MDAMQAIDYEFIFQHAPIGMCISRHRVIQACNEALAKMFGYQREALIGKSFCVLYPTVDEFNRIGHNMLPTMSANGCYADERIMKRASDELFWCHVCGNTLQREDPHASAIWSFEDLSSKRTVAAEMTPREREIAALLIDGKTSKLIARQIGLSPRTVEMHRSRLMRKFSAANSSELVYRLQKAAF
ncbi:MAG TPA: PAS and helix-turn-helix domain-containing protein [Burkholderiaceae bacterium]|jgi:PAS domain S-box-containing protein